MYSKASIVRSKVTDRLRTQTSNAALAEVSRDLSIAPRQGRPHLRVNAGNVLHLTTAPDAVSAVRPVMRRTASVDVFKRWVGVEDSDDIANSRAWPLPSGPWNGRQVRSKQELSAEELADIEMAGRAYIFGCSDAVASYRPMIELVTRSFEVAVYAADRVTIAPGARLLVTGAPAVLLFNDVEIQDGGALHVNAVCRAVFGALRKTAATPHHA